MTSARLLAMQILVPVRTVATFFDCPVLIFFSILRPGRTARPIFTLYGKDGFIGG